MGILYLSKWNFSATEGHNIQCIKPDVQSFTSIDKVDSSIVKHSIWS